MSGSKRIAYRTILAAKRGDAEAMERILRRYEGYITTCSVRRYRDEYGNRHPFVDWELREQIRATLMDRIINSFDTERMPEGESQE